MKIKRFQSYYCILIIGLIFWICGCQDSSSVIDGSKKDSEVVLRDYNLSEDETWESEKIYIIHGTLEIPSNIVLEVLPGTVVKFAQDALIKVRGTLKIGTPLSQDGVDELVNLTSNNSNPESGDWKGILFDHTHDIESFLRATVVEYAEIALDVKTASPKIVDSTFRYNGTAIALDGSNAIIQYNAIHDNDIGIYTIGRQTRPQIEKNNIIKNDTGIFCENVQSIIENNNLENNNYALSLNVKFDLGISNNWWGTVVNAEIDRMILDSNDSNIITKPLGTVHYEPIAETRFADAGPQE
ncbi:MAG: right-handed parallel beta-helix repeat-containing protein [Candidatus Poribacteria bacterium]|nr:right-handed parallel beta-helix repeat-containing protein [Candidatus Poribacteria bacterium]